MCKTLGSFLPAFSSVLKAFKLTLNQANYG